MLCLRALSMNILNSETYSAMPLCLRALSMKILNSETYSAVPSCLVNENTEFKDIQCPAASLAMKILNFINNVCEFIEFITGFHAYSV